MIRIDNQEFIKDMNSIVQYAEGFLEGIKRGQPKLLHNVAQNLKDAVGEYIDASAQVAPYRLHHVYEWYATGSPAARLFTIHYDVRGNHLTMRTQVRQSTTIKDGSKVPFRDKAFIMENGISVTIRPKNSPVLVFDVNGKTVFTSKPVFVPSPGGPETTGGLESTFREFFTRYLSQSTIFSSGLKHNLENPIPFKQNMRKARARGARSTGVLVGMNWISKEVD